MNTMNTGMFIDLGKCEDLVCDCGSVYFVELTRVKIVPALISPSGRPETIVLKVLKCEKCGKILDNTPPPITTKCVV